MKITRELSDILQDSFLEARNRKHEYITPEHFLYVAIRYPTLKTILQICNADVNTLNNLLSNFLETKVPASVENKEPEQSIQFQKLFEFAVTNVYSTLKDFISVEDIIISIFDLPDSNAAYYLNKASIQKSTISKVINSNKYKQLKINQTNSLMEDQINEKEVYEEEGEEHDEEILTSKKKFKIADYATELVQKAKANELAPFIGREYLLTRVMEILCRKYKNNPLLVGEAGVGKTAIVEGLAQLIASGKVPPQLKDTKLYLVDMGGIISGTKFRGQFEQRIQNLFKYFKNEKNCIVFIDEIHTVIGAGATVNSSLDASNLIKPFLTSGNIRCIGATTYEEFRKVFEKDRPLARRFQKVDVPETTAEETIQILNSIKHIFETHHNVRYTESAIEASVSLSLKYLRDKFLPDKAIDLIDEAGSHARLFRSNSSKSNKMLTITETDIQTLVSKISKVPEQILSSDDKNLLSSLESNLKSVIVGQDKAINIVVEKILMARSGLKNPDKPIASLLFVGPSGVGKTELSKQLANFLAIPFIRFDMSEYQEKHTISRLIGAPAGYVGYEEGGLLTNTIIRNPYCVLLLDEIEKAHPDIFNALLQIMDYATLTDNSGKKADFRNVILIMTSNAGTRFADRRQMGFTGDNLKDITIKKAIENYFSPEFRNRLDTIVYFNSLNIDKIVQIVRIHINEFSKMLETKKIVLKISEKALQILAKKAYTEVFGAREVERIIDDEIKKKFINFIVFERQENDSWYEAFIEYDDNDFFKITFSKISDFNPQNSIYISKDNILKKSRKENFTGHSSKITRENRKGTKKINSKFEKDSMINHE